MAFPQVSAILTHALGLMWGLIGTGWSEMTSLMALVGGWQMARAIGVSG